MKTNAPLLLDKLVSLTAIQDIELMEFSLLKTLAEFLRPQELSILKLDRRGMPCYQLHLRQEKYEILSENFSLSEEIYTALDIVQGTKQAFRTNLETGNMLITWHVHQTKTQNVFLVAVTVRDLSKLDSHMIRGLLQIYRNFYQVLIEAQRDQLTGLANRKTFEEVVQKIYSQPAPVTDPVPVDRRSVFDEGSVGYWLGMVDVDNFKRINDTWGHLYGDEVLLLLSQLMQHHFRESDFLFRFGGEEFVVIVRAGTKEHAAKAFERFRSTVEKHSFPQVGQVTISVGVTRMNPEIFIASLLDRADQSLYHAKKRGRNRIEFFEDLLEEGLVKLPEITAGEIELF
ncbi:MAG TPA: GGDEF domain-containing protein [Geobacteraceae bacterium]|nr:GGDEF domain-containing protein [Geobacteraceae bacterium]